MSHFAKIDENNIVVDVVVGNDHALEGDEGYSWIVENLGGRWIKTSYNGNIRKNYATIGGVYDEKRDAFIPVKPSESWILDEETLTWAPPQDESEL